MPRRPPREWWYRCTAGVAASGSSADPNSVCGALWYHKMRAADKRLIVQKAEEKKMRKNPVTLRIKEGTRVEFRPTPASLALYSDPPSIGALGRVSSVSTGRGKRTSIPGPGGGLVYVKWDDGSFQGVSSLDLVKLPDLKSIGDEFADTLFGPAPRKGTGMWENPAGGGGGMLALAALAAAGVAWLLLRKPATAQAAPGPAPQLPAPPAPLPAPATCPLDTQKLFEWGSEVGVQVVHLFGMEVMPSFEELKKGFPSTQESVIAVLKDGSFWRYVAGTPTAAPDMKNKYCEWAAKPAKLPPPPPSETPPPPTSPPPPPPTPAPSPPQSAALQGGGGEAATVYVTKRLFVWTGNAWKLEDDEDAFWKHNPGTPGLTYMAFFAWPTFQQTLGKPPPYYYSDGWKWDGTWTKVFCATNYAVAGCQKEA